MSLIELTDVEVEFHRRGHPTVRAVAGAAERAVREGFLLDGDAAAMIRAAQASAVLK